MQEISDINTQLEALQAAISGLEKQYQRAGREQLKANALAERQAERLDAALESLRQTNQRREAELETLREQGQRNVSAARLEVAMRMFAVVDGLDEAIRAGQRMLLHTQANDQALLQQLLLGTGNQADQHMQSWLHGLEFVRQRLLDALAAERVMPMHVVGQPFDPHSHIAVEVVSTSGSAHGSVVHEIRRGFLHGERVVRHAEVTVAR